MPRRNFGWPRWVAGIALIGCGTGSPDGGPSTKSNDASAPILTTGGDARVPDFACDSGTDHDVELSDVPREPSGCIVSNPNVRFRADILPVLGGCSGELCHDPPSYAATVNVSAFECCDGRRLIDPGNPEGSYLLQKIRGVQLCGGSAKMGNVPIDVAKNIADWICLGAIDN